MPITEPGVAVVTGAASGIGRAAAVRLASEGWRVAAVDLASAKLDQSMALLSGDFHQKIEVDLSAAGSAEDLTNRVLNSVGPPSFLMNNAATRVGRGFDAPMEEWRKLMDVNFWALVETCRLIAPQMKSADGGVIVNVGSKQGITNPPGHPIYNIAKSAVKTYTEALEHELRSQGGAHVSTHLLIPGWTTTGDALHKQGAWLPDQVVDMMLAGVKAGDFYIVCPDDETTAEMDQKRIRWAADDIIENRPPLSRWHPEWREKASKACS